MDTASPLRTIQAIDKDIDAVVKTLRSRRPISEAKKLSPATWQAAWDAEPELHARSQALWQERGQAQHLKAERDFQSAMRETKTSAARPKKCPTCGHRTA